MSVEVIESLGETQPLYSFSSENLALGEFYSNQSVIKTISFTNISQVSANRVWSLSGTDFTMVSDQCSNKDILPNRTCSVKVSFSASGKSIGLKSSTLNISNGQSLPVSASVLEQGQSSSQGAVEIVFLDGTEEKDELSFGVVPSSAIKIITIKNVGSITSAVLSAQLTNSNFSFVSNGCLSKSLTPNKSCQVRVQFSGSGKPVATLFESSLDFGPGSLPLKAGTNGYVFNNFPVISNLQFSPGEVSGSTYILSEDTSLNVQFNLDNNVAGNLQVKIGSVCGLNDLGSAQVAGNSGSKNLSVSLQPNVYNSFYVQLESQAMLSSNCLDLSVYQCETSSGKHFYEGLCEDNSRACNSSELAAISESTSGTATWDGVSSYQCQIESCNSSFHVEGNACFDNVRSCNETELAAIPDSATGTATWDNVSSYQCQIETCVTDHHVEGNACFDNTRACTPEELETIPNATTGVATWNQGTESYVCAASDCGGTTHEENGMCVDNVRACSPSELAAYPNSLDGTATWNSGTESYSCVIANCENDYRLTSGQCVGTRLYFLASHASYGNEIWSTDGTEAGTSLFMDALVGTGSSPQNRPMNSLRDYVTGYNIERGIKLNGKMLISLNTAATGLELFLSDGTVMGTTIIRDINPGATGGITSGNGVLWNGKYYFAGNNGVNGSELWVTDGTFAGTVMLKDTNPGATGGVPSFGNRGEFLVFNGKLYFRANNGTAGIELWMTDGTESGTVIVKDINAGTPNSSPHSMVELNGSMFFVATTAASGAEIWKSDGTNAGTLIFKEFGTGTGEAGTSSSMAIAVMNGYMYFSARVVPGTSTSVELHKSDGTLLGTSLVKDMTPDGGTGTFPIGFTQSVILDGKLYMQIQTGNVGSDREPWVTDGTPAGTFRLKDINPGIQGSGVGGLVVMNNKVYFFASDTNTSKYDLWETDGTELGTVKTQVLNGTSSVSNVTVYKNKIYFSFRTAADPVERLYATDGTPGGLTVFKNSGATGTTVLSQPFFMVY